MKKVAAMSGQSVRFAIRLFAGGSSVRESPKGLADLKTVRGPLGRGGLSSPQNDRQGAGYGIPIQTEKKNQLAKGIQGRRLPPWQRQPTTLSLENRQPSCISTAGC